MSFALPYVVEAMIPVELGTPTQRVLNFGERPNEKAITVELYFLDDKRLDVDAKNAIFKQRSEKYHNSKVKFRTFQVGDLVLR